MSSFFVHGAIAWTGLALLSIPILIHLINRRRFLRIDWAAMEFLLEALKRNRRRLRLEQLILLLLRMALLLLVAFVLARPVLSDKGLAWMASMLRSEDKILLLDDSFSTSRKEGGKTAFGRAVDAINGQVRKLAEQLTDESVHPWDKVQSFAVWTTRNIRPKMGSYLGVVRCLEMKLGDCEDMAALMVALCRASGIPARLVWVPNHNWIEFYLEDQKRRGHWIPVHTAAYFWFGWTGAHELVIQKGDRIPVPERRKSFRLQEDWMQWQGRRPRVSYVAQLKPVAKDTGTDPGPGAREKIASGEWKLSGSHPLDRLARR